MVKICPALSSVLLSCAMKTAAIHWKMAAPSMFTVAPMGRMKRLMRLSTPLFSSTHFIIEGRVAELVKNIKQQGEIIAWMIHVGEKNQIRWPLWENTWSRWRRRWWKVWWGLKGNCRGFFVWMQSRWGEEQCLHGWCGPRLKRRCISPDLWPEEPHPPFLRSYFPRETWCQRECTWERKKALLWKKIIGTFDQTLNRWGPSIHIYHMIQDTSTIVASLNALKKRISSSPSCPSIRRATPNTIANSTRPRMFMPSVSVPIGT